MNTCLFGLSTLHDFFRQVSQGFEYFCMLGGNPLCSELEQWIIIGLGCRQSVSLTGSQLSVNGQTMDIQSSDRLFSILYHVQQSCHPWCVEQEKFQLPLSGGLISLFGYEFYQWCDSTWVDRYKTKDESEEDATTLVAVEFEHLLLLNLTQPDSGWVVLSEKSGFKAHVQQLWQDCLSMPASQTSMPVMLSGDRMQTYLNTFASSLSQEGFEKAVQAIQHCITTGELYQANVSIAFQKVLQLDPYMLFEQLCQYNPSPFSAFFQWPGGIVISNSPERLVKLAQNGLMQTRPIAGTRGRGKTAEEDTRVGDTLLANPKERAEHMMLVDLARNDLGKVAEPGSVYVDELLVLERYSHVTHLVSNVIAMKKPELSQWDVLKALFPCGTITGCPKIRCIDKLADVEPVSRGIYTGSLGYMDNRSSAMAFNILIRSLFLKPVSDGDNTFETCFNVGAGIVDGAVAAFEYRECLRKASAILSVLYGVEYSPLLG